MERMSVGIADKEHLRCNWRLAKAAERTLTYSTGGAIRPGAC